MSTNTSPTSGSEPGNLCLFAKGLPQHLAEACIDLDSPDTFEEWAQAT
jgi:hypothetical protein